MDRLPGAPAFRFITARVATTVRGEGLPTMASTFLPLTVFGSDHLS